MGLERLVPTVTHKLIHRNCELFGLCCPCCWRHSGPVCARRDEARVLQQPQRHSAVIKMDANGFQAFYIRGLGPRAGSARQRGTRDRDLQTTGSSACRRRGSSRARPRRELQVLTALSRKDINTILNHPKICFLPSICCGRPRQISRRHQPAERHGCGSWRAGGVRRRV